MRETLGSLVLPSGPHGSPYGGVRGVMEMKERGARLVAALRFSGRLC